MSDPTLPPAQPLQPTGPAASATPPPPRKKRKRRWWLRVLIALPILLILLVLLAPTLLSLGFVRAIVVPRISSAVAPNGKLAIDSWKFAWFGGQRIEGITLYDDQNAAVAHLNVKTDASIWSALRGNYAVGDTNVTGDFDVRVDSATGRINAMHILGLDEPTKPSEPSKPEQPATGAKKEPAKPADNKLPIDLSKVSGKLTLNLHGTISPTDPADKTIPLTNVDHANFAIDLSNLENGTKIDGDVAMRVAGKPASLTINGTADAIENNAILTDPNKIAANLVASVQQLDLSVANAFLAQQDTTVGGTLKGKLLVNLTPGSAAVVKSDDNLGIENFTLAAPQLKGDTFSSKRVDVPISITRSTDADPLIKIDAFGIKSDIANLLVTGSLPQSVIQNLQAKHAPGKPGQIVVVTDVPAFAKVVAMFPNLAKLQDGVQVTGGGLHNQVTLDIKPDAAAVTQALNLDAQGTSNGKPIQIQKITLNTSADVALRDGLAVTLADVLGFKLDFTSSFATATGSGVPSKANLVADVDLAKLKNEVTQFVDKVGETDLTKVALVGTAHLDAKTNGDPTQAGQPLQVAATFNVKNATVGMDQTTYLNNENIDGNVDVSLAKTDQKQVATFNALAVHSDSGLFDVETVGTKPWFAMFANGSMGGVGQLKIGAALDRLLAPLPAVQALDPSMRLKRGRLDSTITASLDDATKTCAIALDATINRLTVGNALNEETVHFVTQASLPADFGGDGKSTAPQEVSVKTYELTSSFANVHGNAQLRIKDPSKTTLSPFEMARGATFTGAVPSLPKLYALVNSFGAAPADKKVDANGKPLPPMTVDGGALAFDGNLKRDDAHNLSAVTFNVPGISDLAVSRGDNHFRQADPITLSLAANLTTDSSKATVSEQLQHLVVSNLQAKMPGLATLNMTEPIDVAFNPGGKPAAKGHVTGDANLANVGQLLAVVNGANPLPYTGNATFDQRVNDDGAKLGVVGNLNLANLAPLDPKAAPLPEKVRKLAVTNDVVADSAFTTLTLNKVDLVAPDAKDVFHASVVGTVHDLLKQNTMDGVKATLAYDLAQLWPLVQPIVDPTGTSIGKVQDVAGKYEKTFNVSGSYPMVDSAGKPLPFNQSLRSLVVTGDLAIDRFNAAEKGVDISKLTLPLTVKNGIATIAYADGKTGGGTFTVNEGSGDLGGLSVNLAGDEPVLGDTKNHKLVTGAKINPVVANSLGKYISPMFPNATTATGALDLTLSSNGLHLGKSLFTDKSGSATVLLNIKDMEIGNPLSQDILGGLINKVAPVIGQGGVDTAGMNNFVGEVRDGKIQFNRGVVTEDITFLVGEGPTKTAVADNTSRANAAVANANTGAAPAKQPTLYPFSFNGDIRLSDLNMNLAAGFPMALLKDKIHSDQFASLLQYLPEQAKLGLTGTTTNAKLAFDDSFVRAAAEGLLRQQAGRLIGGKDKNAVDGKGNATGAGGNAGSGKETDAQKAADILGGLLGGKAKDDGKSSDNGKSSDKSKTNDNSGGGNADRANTQPRTDQPATRDDSNDDEKKSKAQKRREAEQQQKDADQKNK